MAAIASRLLTTWRALEAQGWSQAHHRLADIYPMPGDHKFDNDQEFDELPIFPAADGRVVRAGDLDWPMPIGWAREYETRPLNQRLIKFDRDVDGLGRLSDQPNGRNLIRALQRAMYLEMFRYRKPLAFSTLRRRAELHFAFVAVAAKHRHALDRLDYKHLIEAVHRLSAPDRKSLSSIYELLRWWRSRSPKNYKHFTPPPSPKAVIENGIGDGFDPSRIRDDEGTEEDRKYQPLPDPFVARLGKIALELVEHVRPVLNNCLKGLAELNDRLDGKVYRAAATAYMASFEWPKGYRPKTLRQLRKLAYHTQTATQILTSLLLGPRSSELLALRISAVKKKRAVVLNGRAFKSSQNFSGDPRDWPLHPTLGAALIDQAEYVRTTEGPRYGYMWKGHVRLFGNVTLQSQIDNSLADFVEHHGLAHLLKGTRCHHHRFRKTVARLIVIALYGGPVVLRRLFGHEHLAMTLRYILANDSIVDELRQIAEDEHKRLAARFIKRAPDVLGRGGKVFREVIERGRDAVRAIVPEGKKDQARTTTKDLVEFLVEGQDSLSVKQILPGLIACCKPREAAGKCCLPNELPNVARCSAECDWHLMLPEFEAQAVINVANALRHIGDDPTNKLMREHYERVVWQWHSQFPKGTELKFAGSALFADIIRRKPDAER